jgi:predicted Zn-dependent protease with MMP-like domain
MKDALWPSLRAAALTAFIAGLLLLFLNPPSLAGLEELVSLMAGALAIVLVTAWVTTLLIGREMPEPDFQKLESRSEALGRMPPPERAPTEFDELVIQALDDLPAEFRDVMRDIPVVVSHLGHEYRAYGHYMGGTVARDHWADKIVIYQDTLERDFGHDPALLRAQVERTVRHEVAHHLGWGESGVRALGL